jgi:heme/copper-type cytochrome/quinol oxidase subunit 1
MGAVFALFAAFYYWILLFTGKRYPVFLAQSHFWFTFISVNLTFFPMHFLGLSGMPRRIPDYPDAYAYINYICSLGALLTLFSIFLFMIIIFYTFISEFLIIRVNVKNRGSYIVYYWFNWNILSKPGLSYDKQVINLNLYFKSTNLLNWLLKTK